MPKSTKRHSKNHAKLSDDTSKSMQPLHKRVLNSHSSKGHQCTVSPSTNPSEYPRQQISTPRRNLVLISSDTTTLLVWDSIIRDGINQRIKMICFPRGTICDIMEIIPQVLKENPKADDIVIHVSSNYIHKQQSEVLNQDFLRRLDSFNSTSVKVHILGPIPTIGWRCGHFSRLLALNTWPASTCAAWSVHFTDKFNLFWERIHFFKADWFHTNISGTQILIYNLFYSISQPPSTVNIKQH